ncbi:hypothetical protein DHEL01_v209081 [Diaporthe helianthi]|uniref:Uncharacterized protein n=1 Tax=Diaporthe helianthi TaxID=158607 RepID=A0A2P5HQI2_DIAHE|nr:hypothetical protein DHEL01_v209081 [Diaporthe helianthi]
MDPFSAICLTGNIIATFSGSPVTWPGRSRVAIQELAAQCDDVAVGLMGLVDSLRARTSKSKRESLRAGFREWRKGAQKDELPVQLRLNRCRSQLNLRLNSLMRPAFWTFSSALGSTRSPSSDSVSLSIEHERGSTGENLSTHGVDEPDNYEDDDSSSIMGSMLSEAQRVR